VKFAEGTVVPVAKTRGEIEALASKYGASEFSSGWSGHTAMIQFMARGRRVRFVLDLPASDWGAKDQSRHRASRESRIEAETRRRWRCLLLAIKAKLEVVESGISTFDEEFLAHIVIEDRTVFERIREASANGRPMLPAVGA
jgi:hypothetical protein